MNFKGNIWPKISSLFDPRTGFNVCHAKFIVAGCNLSQSDSHILYAFANLKPDSGEVNLSDIWADQDIHYPGDSWNDQGKNLYGNFKAIYNLKKQNRHLKVMLSIGGWTYSPSFPPIATHPGRRAKFVQSTIELLEDYGLDGYVLGLMFLHLACSHMILG